jgi:nucleoid-associated protein YgaU
MKKIAFILALAMAASAFAASYKNNTYQKLANEYTKKAEAALDAGEYALSEEYAAKAAENAELSKAYIDKMLAQSNAEKAIAEAKKKLDWAKSVNADKTFPTAYSAAEEAFSNANTSYDKGDYLSALQYAKAVNDALDGVREVTPLPQFYVVRPWAETKDCYWNISGRKYVYNNPLLWENLYNANKSKMPRPNDPNLILPGMKMEIPSISGELREGTYNPNKDYEPFGAK